MTYYSIVVYPSSRIQVDFYHFFGCLGCWLRLGRKNRIGFGLIVFLYHLEIHIVAWSDFFLLATGLLADSSQGVRIGPLNTRVKLTIGLLDGKKGPRGPQGCALHSSIVSKDGTERQGPSSSIYVVAILP